MRRNPAQTGSAMDDDQFTKLFKYMQHEFSAMRSDMERLETRMDERFDHVYSVLDSILKTLETHEQEQIIIKHQLTRHEGWISQLAHHTGVQLAPDP